MICYVFLFLYFPEIRKHKIFFFMHLHVEVKLVYIIILQKSDGSLAVSVDEQSDKLAGKINLLH